MEKHKIEEDNILIIAQKKQLQITIDHSEKEINDKNLEINSSKEDIIAIEEQAKKYNDEIQTLMSSLKIKRELLKKTINNVGEEETKNDDNNKVEESMKNLMTKFEYDKFLDAKDNNTKVGEQLEHLQRELYYLEVD